MTAERKDRIRKLVKEIQDIEHAKNELCRRKRAVAQQAKAELGYGDSDFDAIEEVLLALWGPVSAIEPQPDDFPNEDLIAIIEQWGDDIENVVTTIPQESLQACDEDFPRATVFQESSMAPVQRAVYEMLKTAGPIPFRALKDRLPNIGPGVSAGLSHLSRKGLAVKEDGIWRAL
jgi:hypothetical protein